MVAKRTRTKPRSLRRFRRQVLALHAKGKDPAAIAEQVGLSEGEVRLMLIAWTKPVGEEARG